VKYRVFRSKLARDDLAVAIDYLAARDVSAAKGLSTTIETKLAILRLRPLAFRERPEFGEGVRCIQVSRFLVLYHVKGQSVFVERFIHQSRNAEEFLRRTEKT
jgi:toxin ParE1/3/4